MSPSPENSERPPLAIAHRGWHKVHLENTMEAFRAAYAAGCDMVEFDVQLSRDGVPLVFHDDTGRRLAGHKEAVHALDWKDLREWVLRPGNGSPSPGYRIPTLEQFLTEFGSRAFYLELKVPQAMAQVEAYWQSLGEKCAALVQAASPRPETFLASFHLPVLSHLARTHAFPNRVAIFETLEHYREALHTRAPVDRYSLSWKVYRKALKSATASPELEVGAERILLWDVHGEEDMRAAKSDGVYALCADDVESMVGVCKPNHSKGLGLS